MKLFCSTLPLAIMGPAYARVSSLEGDRKLQPTAASHTMYAEWGIEGISETQESMSLSMSFDEADLVAMAASSGEVFSKVRAASGRGAKYNKLSATATAKSSKVTFVASGKTGKTNARPVTSTTTTAAAGADSTTTTAGTPDPDLTSTGATSTTMTGGATSTTTTGGAISTTTTGGTDGATTGGTDAATTTTGGTDAATTGATSGTTTTSTTTTGDNNGGEAPDVDVYADELCENYCYNYFNICSSYNLYLNPEGSSAGVSSITTNEPDLPRENNLKRLADASAECLAACMKWPRPIDPRNYTGDEWFGSRLAGDTFWCRDTHLHIATFSINQAAFHCAHASNPSAGICRDALIDGFTPYEWLREGADTKHRVPFCDLASNDKVADCTMGGVTESNLGSVLAMLPDTVEMLFLNGNEIPNLNDGVFANNLRNSSNLKALYANNCGIEYMGRNALQGLGNLVVFAAYENDVKYLDQDFLTHTPKLIDFSMAINRQLFAATGNKFPSGFFNYTPELEMLNMYQCTGLTEFDEGTFDQNPNLRVLSFVDNIGITSFPDGLFDQLYGLEHFHFFGNRITSFPANFFGEWARSIISLVMWNCPIDTFSTEGLENLGSIEQAIFHTEPPVSTKVGPTFANFGEVFDILRGHNPLVTFTYGNTTAPTPVPPPPPIF